MYTDIFMDQQLQVVIDFVRISLACSPTQKDIALFLNGNLSLVKVHSAVPYCPQNCP